MGKTNGQIKSFVYFLSTNDNKTFKYGRTNNPERRIKELQTGAQSKWYFYKVFSCNNYVSAIALERYLKETFSRRARKRFGEVLEIPKTEVDWAIFEIKTKIRELFPEWGIEEVGYTRFYNKG